MPIYRVTFGFAGNNVGWTENHLMNSQSTTAQAAWNQTKTTAAARAAMLARPFVINGTRVSAYSNNAIPPVRTGKSVWLDKSVYGPGGNVKAWDAEPNSVQLQAIGTAAPNNIPAAFAGNKNTTYLGAPTDDMVTANGTVVPAANNLAALFAAWKTRMIENGFGWGADTVLGDFQITNVVQNADSTVTFTVVGATVPPLAIGTVYPVRVRRINKGRSPLNGPLICRYTAANTFTTIEQVAFGLQQVNGFLKAYAPVRTYVAYADITLAMAVVKHKRGKPFLSELGRAKDRVRA